MIKRRMLGYTAILLQEMEYSRREQISKCGKSKHKHKKRGTRVDGLAIE